MAEVGGIIIWTFLAESQIPNTVDNHLADGEKAIAAYTTLADTAVFTDRRMIVCDAAFFKGKRIKKYSLPYTSINMWSTEKATGSIDIDSEVELWTSAGKIKIDLQKGIDIGTFEKLIANAMEGYL